MTNRLGPGRSMACTYPRITFARALLRLGRFIQSASIMVMREDDLVEFGRQTYGQPQDVAAWNDDGLVSQGLNPEEVAMLQKLPFCEGRLLVVGVGGGREAIPLARMGFTVTGLDFVSEMVEAAKKNAARQGLEIEGLVQEMSELNTEPGLFALVWLSPGIYSCIPTRKRRTAMLARIHQALQPGGYCACQFIWGRKERFSRSLRFVRRTLAWVTRGNLSYEPGDMLWHNIEFVHTFASEDELRAEFEQGRFEVVYLHTRDGGTRGEALLRKTIAPGSASLRDGAMM